MMHRWLIFSVSLCLLFFATRLYAIESFPFFLDEVDHVDWAQDIYEFQPLTGAINGKLFGLWWMASFHLANDSDTNLFVVRVATALFQCLSIAGLLTLGRVFANQWAGILAAVIFILSPYGFFYHRLALVDAYVAVFGILALWFALRFRKTNNRWEAIASGAMIIGAILAKASGVMLWIVPLLAYVLLPKIPTRERIRATIYSYVTLVSGWLAITAFLAWRGYDYFGTATQVVGVGVESTNILQNALQNAFGQEGILYIDVIFFTAPFIIGALIAWGFYLWQNWRNALLLLSVTVIPLGGLLAFAEKLSPRYFYFHVPFAILLAGVGFISVITSVPKRFRTLTTTLVLGGIGIWGLVFAIPFQQQYYQAPSELYLPRIDLLEYVWADASGFGIVDVADYLNEQEGMHHIYGILPNCHSLAYVLDNHVNYECAVLKSDLSHQSEVIEQVQALQNNADDQTQLWVLYETTDFTTLEGLESVLLFERAFPRPTQLTIPELYEIKRNRDD